MRLPLSDFKVGYLYEFWDPILMWDTSMSGFCILWQSTFKYFLQKGVRILAYVHARFFSISNGFWNGSPSLDF